MGFFSSLMDQTRRLLRSMITPAPIPQDVPGGSKAIFSCVMMCWARFGLAEPRHPNAHPPEMMGSRASWQGPLTHGRERIRSVAWDVDAEFRVSEASTLALDRSTVMLRKRALLRAIKAKGLVTGAGAGRLDTAAIYSDRGRRFGRCRCTVGDRQL